MKDDISDVLGMWTKKFPELRGSVQNFRAVRAALHDPAVSVEQAYENAHAEVERQAQVIRQRAREEE